MLIVLADLVGSRDRRCQVRCTAEYAVLLCTNVGGAGRGGCWLAVGLVYVAHKVGPRLRRLSPGRGVGVVGVLTAAFLKLLMCVAGGVGSHRVSSTCVDLLFLSCAIAYVLD